MTNTNAIIIGLSLVASSILITGHIDNAQAFAEASYTVTNGGNGLVWVLDTGSGDLILCKPNSFSGKIEFMCVREG